MDNTLDLTTQIELAEKQIKEAKEQRNKLWIDKADGVSATVFSNFVLYSAKTAAEVGKVLGSFETYRDMGEIDPIGRKHYTTAPTRYRINISNGYYENYINIMFGLLDTTVHVHLHFKDMDEETLKFFERGQRGLYETENHYVNLQVHTKEFQDRRVTAYGFGAYQKIDWYGGDKTLLDSNRIEQIINHFLNLKDNETVS